MISSFHEFLQHQQSHLKSSGTESTSRPPHKAWYQQYVTAVCQYRDFLFQGNDARTFLQSQLISDTRKLTDDHSLYTAHCTPKGRVFSTLTLYQVEDNIHALVPESITEHLLERLRRYIMFSKVTIDLSTDIPCLIEAAGPDTTDALSPWFNQLPTSPGETFHHQTVAITRQPGLASRWLIRTTNDTTAITIWQALAPTHTPINQADHQFHLIESGVVEVGAELQEAFLPQAINLDQLGCLSFDKGCYVGQEIIARTTHLGQLKKHLYQTEIQQAVDNIKLGDTVADGNNKTVGRVVNWYKDSEADKTRLLVVLADRAVDQTLTLDRKTLSSVIRHNS